VCVRRCRTVVLFRSVESTTQHPSSCLGDRLPIAHCCFSSQLPGLCQRYVGNLVGLPAYLICRLQSVQNAAARLIFRLRRSYHISDAPGYDCRKGSPSRLSCRLVGRCTLMLHCTFGSSHAPLTSRFDKNFGPLPPIVCLFLPSDFSLLDVLPFPSLMHVYGTIYFRTLPPHRLCLHLSNG